MHNSKSIIMITTICCIYCCKQLVYSSTCLLVYLFTCLLVYLSTRSLVNFSKFLCLLLKQLVYSLTRQLVYIVRNKGNEKKQNRKRLLCKYLIMGIGNGKKKGYNRYFSSWIITIHLLEGWGYKSLLTQRATIAKPTRIVLF